MAKALLEETFCIPATATRDLEGFRRWARSDRFPERGRIDYLAGDLEVDMSPEDLYTHGTVKPAISSTLFHLISETELGSVFIDRTRISSPAAALSAEPDVTVVLWESLDRGRVREIAAVSGKPGRYVELEGAVDLVVEIVSDGSVRKDLKRLPELYATAGVPELWVADARRKKIRFEIRTLTADGYKTLSPDRDGWVFSPLLGLRVRLRREEVRPGRWSYRLEHTEP
jgi:Uma2 family endonuclease